MRLRVASAANHPRVPVPVPVPVRERVRGALAFLALMVLYVVLFSAGGAWFTSLDTSSSAAASAPAAAPSPLTPLLLVAVAAFDVALLALFASRSRLPRPWLAVVLAASFYFVKTFTSTIEAAFFMTNVDASMVPGLFAMTVPLSVVVPPLVAWAFGPRRGARDAPAMVWPPMSRGELALKVALLSVVLYPALFFTFGHFVAWQSDAVRAFYGAPAEIGFVAQMATLVTTTPEVLALEALRGLLWVACALVLMTTTRANAWQMFLMLAALFAIVQNDVHWMPNPLMPPEVRWYHFWETSTSNALLAASIAWLLSRSHARGVRAAGRVRTAAASASSWTVSR